MTPYGADLVETVARAIGEADNAISAVGTVDGYRRILARAALAATFAALQTPSDTILDAATLEYLVTGIGSSGTVEETLADWRAMLAQVQREIGE